MNWRATVVSFPELDALCATAGELAKHAITLGPDGVRGAVVAVCARDWNAEVFFSPRAASILRGHPRVAALAPAEPPRGRDAFALFGDLAAWPPQEGGAEAVGPEPDGDPDAADPLDDWPE